jgi:hypothetical protein
LPLPPSRKPTPQGAIDRQQAHGGSCRPSQIIPHQESAMLDIFMLVLGLGFFAASIGYAYACERL